MTIPIWLILTVGIVTMIAIIVTIVALAAWWGMYLENGELRARLRIVQIDVTGLEDARRSMPSASRLAIEVAQ